MSAAEDELPAQAEVMSAAEDEFLAPAEFTPDTNESAEPTPATAGMEQRMMDGPPDSPPPQLVSLTMLPHPPRLRSSVPVSAPQPHYAFGLCSGLWYLAPVFLPLSFDLGLDLDYPLLTLPAL
ncbi:UNVERIFIED_CONTAM: hypothetical protein K2H54_059799 [Gekko kuhli]